jgi:putative transposase
LKVPNGWAREAYQEGILDMKQSRFSAEQITQILKEAAPRGSAKSVARKYGITDKTIYIWRTKFKNMPSSDVKRVRELEHENSKLKRIVANQALDIDCLKEINAKKW